MCVHMPITNGTGTRNDTKHGETASFRVDYVCGYLTIYNKHGQNSNLKEVQTSFLAERLWEGTTLLILCMCGILQIFYVRFFYLNERSVQIFLSYGLCICI